MLLIAVDRVLGNMVFYMIFVLLVSFNTILAKLHWDFLWRIETKDWSNYIVVYTDYFFSLSMGIVLDYFLKKME
jgi:hypothetical protein